MPKNSPIFFVPGEAYLFVRHDQTESVEQAIVASLGDLRASLFAELLQYLKNPKEFTTVSLLLDDQNNPPATFSPPGSRRLSLVKVIFTELNNTLEDNAKLLRLVLDANYEVRASKEGPQRTGIVGVSPNWIAEATSPDPAPNGGGGPGRHHVKANPGTFSTLSKFNLPKTISVTGQGVVVYVLDSFPKQPTKPAAFQQKPLLDPTAVNDSLDQPSINQLCLHSYYDESRQMCESQLNPPDPMPSHGLFVANIIRAIAPEATIQPVPVLNEQAIGTMISLANGLAAVYRAVQDQLQQNAKTPFVVNMSLAYPNPSVIAAMFWKLISDDTQWATIFGQPRPKLNNTQWATIFEPQPHPKDPQHVQTPDKSIPPAPPPDKSIPPAPSPDQQDDGGLGRFADAIQELINCSNELTQAAADFGLPNGSFIASAGNDRTLTRLDAALPDNLPVPDYPAIDSRVMGVGALDKNQKIARYTNMADLGDPLNGTYTGIWTFGGDYDYDDTSYSSPNPQGGILGEAEPGNYVWWAGTSFAAPIVSGMQALLLSTGDSLFDQDGRVKPNGICQQYSDRNGQNIGWYLPVTQGQ